MPEHHKTTKTKRHKSGGNGLYKLMIVEDEDNTRAGLKKFLPWKELEINNIYEACDGRSALEMLQSCKPDIILCDIKMPRMNGVEFAQYARTVLPNCKIIFISGFTDKEYLKAAIKIGVVDYIEKPIEVSELTELVKKTVKQISESNPLIPEQRIKELPENENNTAKAADNKHGKVKDIIQYIESNYTDKTVSVKKLSQYLHISLNYMCAMFKKTTGGTVNEYLMSIRIAAAKELLINNEKRLYEIAEMTGFSDSNYFSRAFKKHTGITPREFREMNQI